MARELSQSGQSHDLIADHRGDGVARETEDRDQAPAWRGDGCERQRLRGFDRDLELVGMAPDLGDQCFEGNFHEVELAHADPTGCEKRVAALDPLANTRRDRLFVITANTHVDADEAVPLQCREQALPVGSLGSGPTQAAQCRTRARLRSKGRRRPAVDGR